MSLKFSDLDLVPELQAGIDASGFSDCTPIQIATMPPILEGKDVAGLAQTGTGKTAAFLLPLMERILRSQATPTPPKGEIPSEIEPASSAENLQKRAFANWQKTHFVLVLVPTRELAEQVCENVKKLRGLSSLSGVAVYGGVSYDHQKAALREGVQFVVATPGRLIDLYKDHVLDLRQVRAVVFDEADRMFDMGFKDDMKYILTRIPRDRQFLVFSATLNFDVLNTAYQFGAQPVEFNISRDQPKAENVDDKIFHVGHDEKPQHLLSVLRKCAPKQAIIFSNFKWNVARLSQFLNDNDLPSVGISSLLTQAQRTRVMEQFKSSDHRNILVATDVAARGLDIRGVDMVVNYELPDDPENYVHRIGRTGRAGANGIAYSLVSDRDVDALSRIETYLGHKLTVDWLNSADLVSEFKPLSHEREGDRPRAPGPMGRGPGFRPAGAQSDRPGGRRRPLGPRPEGARPGARSGGGGPRDERDRRGGTAPAPMAKPRRPAGAPAPGGAGALAPGAAAEAGGQAAGAPRPPGGDSQHRDRRTGRHRPQNSAAQAARSSAPNGQNSQRHPARGQQPQRPATASSNSRRPNQPPSRRPSASLGQRVSGFFKKIFGA